MDYSKLSDSELLKKKQEVEFLVSKYKNLQLALKVQLNSAYGALGSPYFRFYDLRQAEAITLSGQACITFISKRLNLYLNNLLKTNDVDYIIANDTDSCYVELGNLVKKITKDKVITKHKTVEFLDKFCLEKIEPYITKCFEEFSEYMNSTMRSIKMKREAIADKGLWTAKKRYILSVYNNEGVSFKEPKIKITGLESVRSSTPDIVKEKIEKAISIIMSDNQNELHKFILNFQKEFRQIDLYEIARPIGANNLQDYSCKTQIFRKGTPQQVKGALIYNHLLKEMKLTKKYTLIDEGDKIRTLYLREPNKARTNCISFVDILPPEFELNKHVDYDIQFEKTFLKPVRTILDAIGWKTEKSSSLADLFEE